LACTSRPVGEVVRSNTSKTAGSLILWLVVTFAGSRRAGTAAGGAQLDDEPPVVRLALSAGFRSRGLSILLMVWGCSAFWCAGMMLLLLLGLAVHPYRGWRPSGAMRAGLALAGRCQGWQRWFRFYGIASLVIALLTCTGPAHCLGQPGLSLDRAASLSGGGRIGHPIDLPYLGFPALGQMHFLLALPRPGVPPAAPVSLRLRADGPGADRLSWPGGLLAKPQRGSPPSSPLSTDAPQPDAAAYVDLALLFYTSASFYLFLRWRDAYLAQEGERGWLVLLGAFIGFAGGLKYTAVATPLALAASIVVTWRGARRGSGYSPRGSGGIVAVVAVAIWPLKNWLATGNPFYPFLSTMPCTGMSGAAGGLTVREQVWRQRRRGDCLPRQWKRPFCWDGRQRAV
jgi:hypothetical protein